MNSLKTTALSKAFWSIAAVGIILASCAKDESGVACLAILNPDTLRFIVLDKESGADLFFSDDPAYDTTELKLFAKGWGDELGEVQRGIEEGRGDIHFYRYVQPADTLFLQIADQPLDTIAFTGRFANTPCPQMLLAEVTFNSETPQRRAHGRIISLYRRK